MFLETILILVISKIIDGSKVLIEQHQENIYLSDYCPMMKYCPEGAHVMCMYYDKNNVMGPKCRDPKNITLSSALANKLLDVINASRSKLSQGQEKGKNGESLPKGYGIFRLTWDNELAFFAQVLANQCLLRHDYCRATKKFPDPGQAVTVIRFNGPEWIPASKGGKFTTTGLTEEKLAYAITKALRTWYMQKSQVDVDMVTNFPDWKQQPNDQAGRLYLTMVYGAATQMGCGISAYTDYVYYGVHNISVLYNTVLVICNFSAQPRHGAGVYNTVPPTDTDDSASSCGCPIGSLEDEDCLCLEVPNTPKEPLKHQQSSQPCLDADCDPTIVLLPIINVEDAPPELLVTEERSQNSSYGRILPETESITNSFENILKINLLGDKTLQKSRKIRVNGVQPVTDYNGIKQRQVHIPAAKLKVAKNKNFDKPNVTIIEKGLIQENKTILNQQKHKEKLRKTLDEKPDDVFNGIKQRQVNSTIVKVKSPEPVTLNRTTNHTESNHDVTTLREHSEEQTEEPFFFNQSRLLELPGSQYFKSSIMKSVPRKAFSADQVVNKLLYSKHSIIIPKTRRTFEHTNEDAKDNLISVKLTDAKPTVSDSSMYVKLNILNDNLDQTEEVNFYDILTTETVLNLAEQKIINQKENYEMNLLNSDDKLKNNTATDENEKKLMNLLNSLEQEVLVNHIELREKAIQIFDAKIKKIYEKVVGRPSNKLIKPKNYNWDDVKQRKVNLGRQKNEDDRDIVRTLWLAPDSKDNSNHFMKQIKERKNVEESADYENTVRKHRPIINSKTDENEFIDELNYYKNEHNYDTETDEKYPELNEDEPNEIERPVIKERGSLPNHKSKQKYGGRNRNYRLKYRRRLNSPDIFRRRYVNGLRRRKTYKNEFRNDFENPRYRSNNLGLRKNNKYDNDNANDDILSMERRNYYQNKLDKMERKLKNVRRYNRRKDAERSPRMRAVKPPTRTDNQINSLYTGRARILHGY